VPLALAMKTSSNTSLRRYDNVAGLILSTPGEPHAVLPALLCMVSTAAVVSETSARPLLPLRGGCHHAHGISAHTRCIRGVETPKLAVPALETCSFLLALSMFSPGSYSCLSWSRWLGVPPQRLPETAPIRDVACARGLRDGEGWFWVCPATSSTFFLTTPPTPCSLPLQTCAGHIFSSYDYSIRSSAAAEHCPQHS
jgi:hypothetical protein